MDVSEDSLIFFGEYDLWDSYVWPHPSNLTFTPPKTISLIIKDT